MSETPKSERSVLSALPHSRSHHRSDKRAARTVVETTPEPETELPGGDPQQPPDRQSEEFDILRTSVQAVAELAEIGLTLGTRLLRSAVSRLPRP